MQDVQDYFYQLTEQLIPGLQGEELFLCSFAGEESDFVRFTQGRIRQAGQINQYRLTLELISGQRHAQSRWTLSGEFQHDQANLQAALIKLREQLPHLPEDPFLHYATQVCSSEHRDPGKLPPAEALIDQVLTTAQHQDWVGILASGGMHTGFVNALGQRNWHSQYSFNLDWSFYGLTDQAVKSRYAGVHWQPALFQEQARWANRQMQLLNQSVKTIEPGCYRVYLAPTAMEEILQLLAWGGFGLRSHRNGTTPLLRLVEGDAGLHTLIQLRELTDPNRVPGFQSAGFRRPAEILLVEQGSYRDCLVSPRSAMEFGMVTNGAEADETPLCLDMAAGTLDSEEILTTLDTGIYINNLWYLNYSDCNSARITGMTRFASFWVENGRIQAPIAPMRFDDSLYHLWGQHLLALTSQRQLLMDPHSYGSRSHYSSQVPGAVLESMQFTL